MVLRQYFQRPQASKRYKYFSRKDLLPNENKRVVLQRCVTVTASSALDLCFFTERPCLDEGCPLGTQNVRDENWPLLFVFS